jgi:hypothetical protein
MCGPQPKHEAKAAMATMDARKPLFKFTKLMWEYQPPHRLHPEPSIRTQFMGRSFGAQKEMEIV